MSWARIQREQDHGTASKYVTDRCRCEECRAWNAARARRRAQAARRVDPGLPQRRYQQWTEAELELASRDDLTPAEVAAMVGRTTWAVHSMRNRLRRGQQPRRNAEDLS
jgi:hypothetical protein